MSIGLDLETAAVAVYSVPFASHIIIKCFLTPKHALIVWHTSLSLEWSIVTTLVSICIHFLCSLCPPDVNAICSLLSALLWSPEQDICFFSCRTLHFVHQLTANTVHCLMPRKHLIKSIFLLKKTTIQICTYHVEYTQGTFNWSWISLNSISAMRITIFSIGSAFFLLNKMLFY